MVLFSSLFSLFPHSDCIIFLSFADHRQVRLCLFQNGLRHRITLYPPSRKVSFLFCFAFCVYVHVFTRPYTWSQYSWTLGVFWGRKCDRSCSCARMRSSHTKLRARVGCGLILSWNTMPAKTEERHTKWVLFLTENYLFVAKSASCYYSGFFRSLVSTGNFFYFDVSTPVTFKLSLVTFAQPFVCPHGRDYLTNRGNTHKYPIRGIFFYLSMETFADDQ